jgi:uncharacterized repeat protein (TIGR03806 family)
MMRLLSVLVVASACSKNDDSDPDDRPADTDVPTLVDTDDTDATDVPVPSADCVAGAAPAPPGLAAPQRANQVSLSVEPYVLPQEMAKPPGDDAYWYVALQAGRVVRFVDEPYTSTFDEVLDLSDEVYEEHNQLGMMSLTFHPDFVSNGYMYVFYNPRDDDDTVNRIRISRFTTTDGGASFSRDSEVVLLEQENGDGEMLHTGGHLAFGPDGMFWFSIGDGGNPSQTNHGQDPFQLWGGLFRVDVDAAFPWGIPADNPFADGVAGAPELWAHGLRNPWQWSIDDDTGDLWLGDVGSNIWEELNYIEKGGNYGWNVAEGLECLDAGCDQSGFVEPVYTFPNAGLSAVIAGRVYRGALLPELSGYFLFGDHFDQWLMGARKNTTTGAFEFIDISPNLGLRPASYAEGSDGEIWMIYRDLGEFYTLAPIPPSGPDVTLPTPLLSQTNCTVPTAPAEPAPGMRSYEINVELWSDGASKERNLSLPEGETIGVTESGDFDFPNGTVFLKQFRLGDRLVETRLLVRHTNGAWAGYSYQWNEAQTDATLLAEGLTVDVDGQTWTFPSRAECMTCHTPQAGFALGPEIVQIDRTFSAGTENQLDRWVADGLFTEPLLPEHEALLPLPEIDDEAIPADRRARGYLHTNCAFCHQEGGQDPDFRYFIGLSEYLCVQAHEGKVDGASVLAEPGDPEASVIFARMATTDSRVRMPPLASSLVDPVGTPLIEEWILGMPPCL